MSKSYTAIAGFVQEAMITLLQNGRQGFSSNEWENNGVRYFAEEDESDGKALAGVVYRSKGNQAVQKGTYKVDEKGKVVKWPTSTQDQRDLALEMGRNRYKRVYGTFPQ